MALTGTERHRLTAGTGLAAHVSASTDAVVCRLRYRLGRTSRPRQGAPAVAEAVPADR